MAALGKDMVHQAGDQLGMLREGPAGVFGEGYGLPWNWTETKAGFVKKALPAAGVQTTTTKSDAKHDRGGRVYDIDPGGSSSVGEVRDHAGYLVAANTGDIVLTDGSGAVISFDLASIPA